MRFLKKVTLYLARGSAVLGRVIFTDFSCCCSGGGWWCGHVRSGDLATASSNPPRVSMLKSMMERYGFGARVKVTSGWLFNNGEPEDSPEIVDVPFFFFLRLFGLWFSNLLDGTENGWSCEAWKYRNRLCCIMKLLWNGNRAGYVSASASLS